MQAAPGGGVDNQKVDFKFQSVATKNLPGVVSLGQMVSLCPLELPRVSPAFRVPLTAEAFVYMVYEEPTCLRSLSLCTELAISGGFLKFDFHNMFLNY